MPSSAISPSQGLRIWLHAVNTFSVQLIFPYQGLTAEAEIQDKAKTTKLFALLKVPPPPPSMPNRDRKDSENGKVITVSHYRTRRGGGGPRGLANASQKSLVFCSYSYSMTKSRLENEESVQLNRIPIILQDGILSHQFDKRLESFAPCFSQSLLLAVCKENHTLLWY